MCLPTSAKECTSRKRLFSRLTCWNSRAIRRHQAGIRRSPPRGTLKEETALSLLSPSTTTSTSLSMSILQPYGVASPFPLSEGLSHLALSADAPEFPHPKPASPHFADDSSSEVSKQASRRLYGGPSLSLRSTGGPDAGPLVERYNLILFDSLSYLA